MVLPGQQFASRVAASILSALSSSAAGSPLFMQAVVSFMLTALPFPEGELTFMAAAAALIARSPQDYKALARALIVGRKGRVNR